MVNIYPLSSFGEHYPHLCDACFSSELNVYSVFLTSPAQQTASSQYSSQYQTVDADYVCVVGRVC